MLVNQTNNFLMISDSEEIGDSTSSLWTNEPAKAQLFYTYDRASFVRDHLAKMEDAPIVVVSL